MSDGATEMLKQKQLERDVLTFLRELLDPEGFGWAVTLEVRYIAHQLEKRASTLWD